MSIERARDVVLECENVVKTFPIVRDSAAWRLLLGLPERAVQHPVAALKGVSLSVPRGTIVGILGNNGAGKSTLLRVLGGVYPATSGRVAARGGIAGLFELGGMGNPNLTGREYAERYLRFMGTPSRALAEHVRDVLEFSELGEFFDRRIRTYSSGMAARLYFATATSMQHDIYLIDELLSVGDEHFQSRCWSRLRQRLLNGASGVLVTHDWTAVLKLCEYAYVLERGRISFEGRSDEAVVRHLGLRAPESDLARFSPINEQHHNVRASSDDVISIFIDLQKPAPVVFSYSIESMTVGKGWEILILSAPVELAGEPGAYRADILAEWLPLAHGSYSLNAFLTRGDTGELLDVRSWTFGSSWQLTVQAQPGTSAVRLPYKVARYDESVA